MAKVIKIACSPFQTMLMRCLTTDQTVIYINAYVPMESKVSLVVLNSEQLRIICCFWLYNFKQEDA